MRTELAFIYAAFLSLNVSIVAELSGLLTFLSPGFSEGARVLGWSATIFASFALSWVTLTDPEEEEECG